MSVVARVGRGARVEVSLMMTDSVDVRRREVPRVDWSLTDQASAVLRPAVFLAVTESDTGTVSVDTPTWANARCAVSPVHHEVVTVRVRE